MTLPEARTRVRLLRLELKAAREEAKRLAGEQPKKPSLADAVEAVMTANGGPIGLLGLEAAIRSTTRGCLRTTLYQLVTEGRVVKCGVGLWKVSP